MTVNLSKDKGHLLIVEDDKKTAELVRIYLEREGFHTSVCHDGQKALDLARRLNPRNGWMGRMQRIAAEFKCTHHHADGSGR